MRTCVFCRLPEEKLDMLVEVAGLCVCSACVAALDEHVRTEQIKKKMGLGQAAGDGEVQRLRAENAELTQRLDAVRAVLDPETLGDEGDDIPVEQEVSP